MTRGCRCLQAARLIGALEAFLSQDLAQVHCCLCPRCCRLWAKNCRLWQQFCYLWCAVDGSRGAIYGGEGPVYARGFWRADWERRGGGATVGSCDGWELTGRVGRCDGWGLTDGRVQAMAARTKYKDSRRE
eukprot:3120028-Rhodomonas_salina.1